jgi:hypothetical protein
MSDSHARARARRAGALTVRTIRVPVPAGTLEANGEVVPAAVLIKRLRWLGELVGREASARIKEVWDAERVTEIKDVRTGHAYVAMEAAYGKGAWPPADLHASDRVRRIADEVAGRTLRSAERQMTMLAAILPLILPGDVFDALSTKARDKHSARLAAAWPAGTTAIERRNLWRSIWKFERKQGRLPTDPYELRQCPSFAEGILVCPLDAADDQQVRLAGTALSLLLPLAKKPGKREWAWHILPLALPAWATRRYPNAPLCRPSLRITPDSTYFLVPLDIPVPPQQAGYRVLGLDWGLRRLLTGAVVSLGGMSEADWAAGVGGAVGAGGTSVSGGLSELGIQTTGRPFFFSATGMQGKLYRVRAEAEGLAKKISQVERLLAGRDDRALAARRDVLEREKTHLWARLSAANDQLAQASAKWTIAIAVAENCYAIIFEDLDDLETRRMGKTLNGRISLQVRGMLLDYLIEKGQLAGKRVITVAAEGTSSRCSRCGRPSVFWHAPDRRTGPKGRTHSNWLVCACGRSSDRDHSAAEAIGARGLDVLITEAMTTTTTVPSAPARRSRRRPVPGPASYHPIRVQREKKRRCQRLPLAQIYQMILTRPRDEPAPRCVGRGSVVADHGLQTEHLPLRPVESSEVRSKRILDGLCGGYRYRIRISRVRALAPPPEIQLSSSA